MDQRHNSQDSRSLRSKGTEDILDDGKFDFDEEEYSIDPDKKFLILHSRVRKDNQNDSMDKKQKTTNNNDDHPNIKTNELDVQKSKGLITSMILDIKTNKIEKNNSNSSETLFDPLCDETYTSFHKKMLKQENRMYQFDVNQGVNEAERLGLIYDKLDLPSWVSTLQRVTVINDPTNENELLKKKTLTKQHIKTLLYKYNRMQKKNRLLQKNIKKVRYVPIQRTPKIYQNIDRKCDIDYHSSSDEEDDESNIDNSEICRRRLLRREAQCGGSIIIGISYAELNKSKFVIIAEPLKKPYICMTSKEERSNWKNFTGIPKTLQGNVRTNNQIAQLKQKIPIPLTLTAERVNKKDNENCNKVGIRNVGEDIKNNENCNCIEIDSSTKIKNIDEIDNNSVTEDKTINENDQNSIQKNESDKVDKSGVFSSQVLSSPHSSTFIFKSEAKSHEHIGANNKDTTSIITQGESYDIVKSRLCTSEPCTNILDEETKTNDMINSKRIYLSNNDATRRINSAGENVGNRKLVSTVTGCDHINNRNAMSISNITNGTSHAGNCQNGGCKHKDNGGMNDVNILKVRKKPKKNSIKNAISIDSISHISY